MLFIYWHMKTKPIPDIKTLVANSDVEGLIEATAFEGDAKIRVAAAEALGELRDPSAIAPLISLLNEKYHVYNGPHQKAVDALGEIGSPALDILITTLKNAKRSDDPYFDEDANLRAGTARALGKIGDPKAIGELVGALWDKIPFVRWSAADALGR
jgi:HEAT repeat protein